MEYNNKGLNFGAVLADYYKKTKLVKVNGGY